MADDVIFLQPTDATIFVTEPDPEVLVIAGNGGSGPTGPQGPPGGAAFIHVQSTPSAAWVITHNLGTLVHVTVLDTTNAQVEADVRETSVNVTTILFNVPTTGTAVISG